MSKMTHKPSLRVFRTSSELAAAAALDAASVIREAVAARGQARLIAATGTSQLAFLDRLVREPDIDWPRVELFHLDEYVGVSADHPASFRRYLMERLIRPSGMQTYHLLDGEGDPEEVCRTVGAALASAPVDVAFAGIGENGHLAFNDPPADFETDAPYIVVELDEPCRRQQVGEGWFASMDDVPRTAISMTVRQILRSHAIICVVPDRRKADAVRACMEGPITPMAPASILRTHANTTIYLDRDSASLLDPTGVTFVDDASGLIAMTRPIRGLRWYIGAVLFLSTVINYIDRQTLNVLAPILKDQFRWTNADFAWIVIAFRAAYAIGQTGSGRFLDRVGTRVGLSIAVGVLLGCRDPVVPRDRVAEPGRIPLPAGPGRIRELAGRNEGRRRVVSTP